ncbi:MAG TPA: hypothetical protein VFB52_04440 [Solirubrobacterales bacterium]|nr:hypothetical protein [Solirubrobacterales bacterium]
MNRRAICLGVVAILVATTVTAGCGGSSDPTVSRTKVPSPDTHQFVELPTRRCSTQLAYEGVSPVPLDARTPTALPASAPHSDLAAYTNTLGTTLIGPKGWECRSGAGVDGSEFMAIAPSLPEDEFDPSKTPAEAITLRSIPACLGCQAEALCSLFPDAPPVTAYSPRLPCDEKPLRERAEILGNYFATFEDPPRVAGLGEPSGGANPAIGVIAYSHPSGVGKVTCTVSARRRPVCSQIVLAAITSLVTRS